jgi:alcohol dehydrogenase class IV
MALMDPELTVGLPAFWTFFTGMDALVHSLESRTNRYQYAQNNPIADNGIKHAFENLVTAVNEPDNIEARSGMMLAAAYGGLAIGNTGCAVAHNIGHALGSIAAIPHGRAVSVALVATMNWAIEGNREAFDHAAIIMGGKRGEDIPDILHGLAEKCGQSLVLNADEKSKVKAEILAADMVAPANVSMLEATARDASPDDVAQLAEMTLSA